MWSILRFIIVLVVSGSIAENNENHQRALQALRNKIQGLKANHSDLKADKVMSSRNALDILLGKDSSNRMKERIKNEKGEEENEEPQGDPTLIFNIYKDLPCEDTFETCSQVKPLCPIFPRIGHLSCRKSCHVCGKDRPNWKSTSFNFYQLSDLIHHFL